MRGFVIHRSNVNAWDCDENGHLNVRYYISKNYQGLSHLLAEAGLNPARLAALGVRARLASQHVRYHREARVSAPLIGTGQIVRIDGAHLFAYTELRDSMDDTLYTTFNSDIVFIDDAGEPTAVSIADDVIDSRVPEPGQVRSLGPSEKPVYTVASARAAGFVESGRGTVTVSECDAHGRLDPYQYAARIADAIPNFMSTMQTEAEFALRAAGELGGAVIESRADYHAELLLGHRFVLLSGLRSFTAKTMHLVHLMFDLESDALAFYSQGIGVALDLRSRRAVPFADERRALMRARIVDT